MSSSHRAKEVGNIHPRQPPKQPQPQPRERALVYAVTSGPAPGIYFEWNPSVIDPRYYHCREPSIDNDDDTDNLHLHSNFKSFSSQAGAERYFQRYFPHLRPPENTGWLSTGRDRKKPLLYTSHPIPPSTTTTASTGTTVGTTVAASDTPITIKSESTGDFQQSQQPEFVSSSYSSMSIPTTPTTTTTTTTTSTIPSSPLCGQKRTRHAMHPSSASSSSCFPSPPPTSSSYTTGQTLYPDRIISQQQQQQQTIVTNDDNKEKKCDVKNQGSKDYPIEITSPQKNPTTCPRSSIETPPTTTTSTSTPFSVAESSPCDSSTTTSSRSSSSSPEMKTQKQPPQPVCLDEDQQRAVESARLGRNIFLTGVAGTGKSFLINILYEEAVNRFRCEEEQEMMSSRHWKKTSKSQQQSPTAFHDRTLRRVALCAPTGMASVALGKHGQTLHSMAGIGIPQRASDFSTCFSRPNSTKWRALRCMILDECGMVSADLLDWLDITVRKIRHQPEQPFGGIQLIFVGDFCQLGPVPGSLSLQSKLAHKTPFTPPPTTTTAANTKYNNNNNNKRRNNNGIGFGPPYRPDEKEADCFLEISECTALAFQTAMWREADFVHIHLTKVYRQSDEAFVQALQDIREQRPDSERVQTLIEHCSIPLTDIEGRKEVFGKHAVIKTIPEGILPTLLYTSNRNADRENSERLAALRSSNNRIVPSKWFMAVDTVELDSHVPTHTAAYIHKTLCQNKFFIDQCQATKQLELAVGAQVMLLQNLYPEEGLVNGSRGVVEKFTLVPMIRELKLTENKKNGQNWKGPNHHAARYYHRHDDDDDDRDGECKLPPEERLLGPDDMEYFPPGYTFEQLKFGMTIRHADKLWKIVKFVQMPLVRFLENKTKIIIPTTFDRTIFGQGTCKRQQIPLRLAWALTIHKAQGCSLDWLICDLQGCFTAGQAYVALSRARSMAGLQIRNYSPKHVMINPLVDEFYKALKKDTVSDFLRTKAGIWWYPLLQPQYDRAWYRMFTEACSTAETSSHSAQFRLWVANYRPPEEYNGWMGYSDQTTPTATTTTLITTTTTNGHHYHLSTQSNTSPIPSSSSSGLVVPLQCISNDQW